MSELETRPSNQPVIKEFCGSSTEVGTAILMLRLGVLLGLFFLVPFLSCSDDKVTKTPDISTMMIAGFLPAKLQEGKDSVITFHGKNFPDVSDLQYQNIKVIIDNRITKVSPNNNGTFSAVLDIDKLKQGVNTDSILVPIEVTRDGKSLYQGTVTCMLDTEIKIDNFIPNNFHGHKNVIFAGKNLNRPGISIEINGEPCRTVRAFEDTLIAELPPLPLYIPITVDVKLSGNNIFHRKATISPRSVEVYSEIFKERVEILSGRRGY